MRNTEFVTPFMLGKKDSVTMPILMAQWFNTQKALSKG
jgi:hypothetical protein